MGRFLVGFRPGANGGKIRHGLQHGALLALEYILEVGDKNALNVSISRQYSVIEKHEIYLRSRSPIWYLK
jgi:hypothetical protein